jgi:hypothetical protein
MNDEQIIIINFLRCSLETWFGKKELARRAVRRRVFEENPRWADEPLTELIAQGLVEENQTGQVRLKEGERKRAKVSGPPDEAKPKVFDIEIDEGIGYPCTVEAQKWVSEGRVMPSDSRHL